MPESFPKPLSSWEAHREPSNHETQTAGRYIPLCTGFLFVAPPKWPLTSFTDIVAE